MCKENVKEKFDCCENFGCSPEGFNKGSCGTSGKGFDCSSMMETFKGACCSQTDSAEKADDTGCC
jgi:hypothetical protein